MAFAFTVNGKAQSVDVDANTPLLWVVREHLKLTGTKFGCGAGLCGACTVHIDGKAVRSCQTTMSEAAGKNITTIEGLSADSSHPLQKAWIAEQVPQCGYCQSGQIMQAAELLARTRRRRASRSSRTWTATSAGAAPTARSSTPSKPRRGADHDTTFRHARVLPPRFLGRERSHRRRRRRSARTEFRRPPLPARLTSAPSSRSARTASSPSPCRPPRWGRAPAPRCR